MAPPATRRKGTLKSCVRSWRPEQKFPTGASHLFPRLLLRRTRARRRDLELQARRVPTKAVDGVVILTSDLPLRPNTVTKRTRTRDGVAAELGVTRAELKMAGVVPLMLLKEPEVGDAKGITNISDPNLWPCSSFLFVNG